MKFNPFTKTLDDEKLSDILLKVREFTEGWVAHMIEETAGTMDPHSLSVDVDISIFNADVKEQHLAPGYEFQEYPNDDGQGFISYPNKNRMHGASSSVTFHGLTTNRVRNFKSNKQHRLANITLDEV